jgi:multisubunit Na+/H+ antiporter MnhG subunit
VLGQFATYALLFIGSAIVGWCWALTIMEGRWLIVPLVVVFLAPLAALVMVKAEKHRRYRAGSKAVIKRYTQEIPIVRP